MELFLKVLLIEDEKDICETLTILLEDEGFNCSCVFTGEAALKKLEDEYFDVALVDIRLPGIDGITFIERAHRLCSDLRFIIFSGSPDINNLNHIKKLDYVCDKIVYKPICDSRILKNIILEFLEKDK